MVEFGEEEKKNGKLASSGTKEINKINFTLEHPLNSCRASSSTLSLNERERQLHERKDRERVRKQQQQKQHTNKHTQHSQQKK